LVVVELRSLLIVSEPPGSSTDSRSSDVSSDGHITEKQPRADEGLSGVTWWLVHDLEIWGVESEGGGGQTICDEVDPEKLYGDEGLWHTESGCQEDTDDLTNVGRDEVADELLHVVVDSATLKSSKTHARRLRSVF